MKAPTTGAGVQPPTGAATGEEKKSIINTELWQACAGPLVNLPAAGTHVVYFPQGHSEQVAASLKKDVDGQVPNYPSLPSKLLCILHSVTLHADSETDEVYAKMTLQPVPSFDKEALLRSDLSMKAHKPQTEFFCKTLTASDTSTHGGFSVPRRAAEKIFPQLDFTMQPPAQELVARDLHDNLWTFRHIYRGQPKRHLLTTGWSLFVGGKRLFAGDSVLFIRDEKQQLLLGIRRANRQQTNLPSSVLSSDSMHIGILAAAAHASANNSPFTVFYNPRASPSEFVIPLAKYYKAACGNQISLGMRFRMMFETEESGTRRYMGTITGLSDLDPVRWKNSQWRNLQVGWDESTAGEKRNRVSVWEVEPVTAPFFICPTPPFFRSKHPRQPGMPDDDSDLDNIFRRTMPWLGDDFGLKDPGLSLVQWMNMQQSSSLANPLQPPNYMNPMPASVLQNLTASGLSGQLGLPSAQIPLQSNNMLFNSQRPNPPIQQIDQLQRLSSPSSLNPLGSVLQSQQQQPPMVVQTLPPTSHAQPQHGVAQAQNVVHQQQQIQRNVAHQPQVQILSQAQSQNLMTSFQSSDHINVLENQIQLQLLQKLHHQQQSLLVQQSIMQQPYEQQQKQLLDASTNFPRPLTISTNAIIDSSLATSSSMVPQPQVLAQQIGGSNGLTNLSSGQQPEISGHVRHSSLNAASNQFSVGGGNNLRKEAKNNGGPSVVTDDIPSCSTSPSTDNCFNQNQLMKNSRSNHRGAMVGDEIAPQSSPLLNSSDLEASMACNGKLAKDAPPKTDVRPSMNIPKGHNNGFFACQQYPHANGAQMDYLDSSSSATSVLSQNEIHIPTTHNSSMAFNSQPRLFRDASQDMEVRDDDLRSGLPFGGANVDNQFGIPMENDPLTTKDMMGSDKDFPCNNIPSGGGVLSGYENTKEAQAELSSSMISQSFGVPDVGFNSIDSAMNEGGFMNKGPWAPPQMPRLRTYTKVYKRGAVGRSIDITRYSGYDELKQDLARRFGIEGQLEDRQRIGWKLVYVDHENDVLLVGDDPWEEFVNCVRCIKILSPQEVQQMSLDGDFGDSLLQNQACSSSDNGLNTSTRH